MHKYRIAGADVCRRHCSLCNDIADLSHKVGQISKWAVENKMKISCGKSGVLVWGTDNSNESDRIIVSTDFGKIGEFTEYRYLGVLVKRTTFEEHLVGDSVFRGKKALEVLKTKLVNKEINIILQGILIKNVLVPIFMYGSELWKMSSTRSRRIIRILRKVVRMVFRTKIVPSDRIIDEFSINRIQIRAALNRFRALIK